MSAGRIWQDQRCSPGGAHCGRSRDLRTGDLTTGGVGAIGAETHIGGTAGRGSVTMAGDPDHPGIDRERAH